MRGVRGTSSPRSVRLQAPADARRALPPFPLRARRCWVPGDCPHTRTRQSERRATRRRWLSNLPPEDFPGGEARERFRIAGEFASNLIDVAAQSLVGVIHQLL